MSATGQVPPKAPPTPADQAGGYPWDAITPVGKTDLEDELEADLANAATCLLVTLLLVSATAFGAGFAFGRLFG